MKDFIARFKKSHVAVRIGMVALVASLVFAGVSAAIPNAPVEIDPVPTVVSYYSQYRGNGSGELSLPSLVPVIKVIAEEVPVFDMEIVYDFTDATSYSRSYEKGTIVYTNAYNGYVYKTDAAKVLVWTNDPAHPLYAVFQP